MDSVNPDYRQLTQSRVGTVVSRDREMTLLPEAVRKQVERADELFRQMQNPGSQEAEPDADGESQGEGEQHAQRQQEPSPSQQAAESPPKDAAQPEQAKEAEDPRHQDPNYWKHRFHLEEGKARKLREKQESNETRISELESKLAEMGKATKAPAEFAPEDVELYGEGFLTMVQKQAEKIAGDRISELEKKLERAVTPLNERMQAREQDLLAEREASFLSDLGRAVPNWEQVNDDPKFHAWLAQEDETSGLTRQEILDRSHQAFASDRVARLFKSFLGEPVGKRVLPAGKTDSRIPAEAQKFTRAYVKKFYDDLARGGYRGREKEADRIDAEITKAQVEGRIT